MYARKRLDLSWKDVGASLFACLVSWRTARLARAVEAPWPDHRGALACLSVRSALDLALSALALPPGTEVIVSAITIADMVTVLEAHGLVAVPVDVDPDTLFPDADDLEALVTHRTRAILVAHLFGGRMPLEPVLEIAKKRDLFVFEDAAQAYTADGWGGTPEADLTLFSFGTIKTGTALGGAVARVKNRALLAHMRTIESRRKAQSRFAFGWKVVKAVGLKLLTQPVTYGVVAQRTGDLDAFVHRAVRGFSGENLMRALRRRPSAPLLALLARRLRRPPVSVIERRTRNGKALEKSLSRYGPLPGCGQPVHTHWVTAVEVNQPDELITQLRAYGFDATQRSSLIAVDPPLGRPRPRAAQRLLRHVVYVPTGPELTPEALELVTMIVSEVMERGDKRVRPVGRVEGVGSGGKSGGGKKGPRRSRVVRRRNLR